MRLPRDKDGFPQIAPGRTGVLMATAKDQDTRITAQQVSIPQLLSTLAPLLDTGPGHIVDGTGLTKTYSFRLSFSSDGLKPLRAIGGPATDPSPGQGTPSNLFGALERQLGLMLERKKVLVNVVVVDHADKIPAAN